MYDEISNEDKNQLFAESIVFYDKEPVYIRQVDRDFYRTSLVKTPEYTKIKSFDDPLFDFTPPSLGFCDLFGSSCFFSRTAKRQYKIGLSSTNVKKLFCVETKNRIPNTIFFPELRNTLLNLYPSVEESLSKLNKDESTLLCTSISREFAVSKDHLLYHCTTQIGMINSENGKPLFQKSKSYLAPLFEENCYAK